MATALATIDYGTPTVTADQLDLIKRTVANGATADELKLYLFDCQRQGVHPLDKLVHFTKRSGKYTPITSIDFMRIRAADTNEYAGSDDAVFDMGPMGDTMRAASVTVWRLVQGLRCAFTATARWAEYKPEQNDFMWKKMPHTMLAKCAEALALRKGFPRQLAGLYAKEEMDQAGEPQGYVVEAPSAVSSNGKTPDLGSGDAGSIPAAAATDTSLPPGALRILKVGPGKAGAAGEITFHKNPGDANKANLLTWNQQIVGLATEMCQHGEPCFVGLKKSPAGNWRIEDLTRIPKNYNPAAALDAEIVAKDLEESAF
jgi:phage recombination protein Bet